MATATVFGAGAMGAAVATHLARQGHSTTLWASHFDQPVLPGLVRDRRHPALPAPLPDSLRVLPAEGLDEAVDGIDLAVMGANSRGARSLARLVVEAADGLPPVVGIAKGLEPRTLKRMSEVYAEEVGHGRVVSMGGPCLAPDIALGLPTVAVFAAGEAVTAMEAAGLFRSGSFHVRSSDDLRGVEYCTVAKNVVAIGTGILDGLGRASGVEYRNGKAALFARAYHELCRLVTALGGRQETAAGPAGLGDALVTSLGGRNRLFGELLGEGMEPQRALDDLVARGMTVEGWDSTSEVHRLSAGLGVEFPFFERMYRILYEHVPPGSVLDCLKE